MVWRQEGCLRPGTVRTSVISKAMLLREALLVSEAQYSWGLNKVKRRLQKMIEEF
jgi:hypothetical protein